jgi:hypothetical protein
VNLSVNNYLDEVESFILNQFVSAGFNLTSPVVLDPVFENAKYEALTFSLNEKRCVYRKANVTPDRPGAFLSVWQRPEAVGNNGNKPIPLASDELDYLFIQVETESERGMFIFPVELLITKGIVSSSTNNGKSVKGKTGFRVFPPWSQDRGNQGMKVFSSSGKKTQAWQLPNFIGIADDGSIDACALKKIISSQ